MLLVAAATAVVLAAPKYTAVISAAPEYTAIISAAPEYTAIISASPEYTAAFDRLQLSQLYIFQRLVQLVAVFIYILRKVDDYVYRKKLLNVLPLILPFNSNGKQNQRESRTTFSQRGRRTLLSYEMYF